jgi:predicted patatin/cPLA2 family phospholipase
MTAKRGQGSDDYRLRVDADVATRKEHPEYYWCVGFDDGSARYYWNEQTVSRAEYLDASGKEDCAS